MMREVGFLFKPEMVRALLRAARGEPFGKFETRRLVPDKVLRAWDACGAEVGDEGPVIADDLGDYYPMTDWARALYGDTIYAREAWLPFDPDHVFDGQRFAYMADTEVGSEGDRTRKEYGYKWKPGIHMPRVAARLFMPDIRVRAERLQDITEDGARREGMQQLPLQDPTEEWWHLEPGRCIGRSASYSYSTYIDVIAGPGTWTANPWVFVYSWERVELR